VTGRSEWPCPRCGATGTQPHKPGCPYGAKTVLWHGFARSFPELIWHYHVLAYYIWRLNDERKRRGR